MARILVTGGGGFVGQWLARALLRRGDRVTLAGLGHQPTQPAVLTPDEWSRVEWRTCDVTSDGDVAALIAAVDAQEIYHLAGISFEPTAQSAPEAAWDVNVRGAVRVISAAAAARGADRQGPVILIVGSGTQYGRHEASEMPLREGAHQKPVSVYGSTKKAQEEAAIAAARDTGLRVVCTRSFNHTGPGQDPSFLVPGLVQRVRALPAGNGSLVIGNDTVRDFLHVTDVVNAYLALADRGAGGEAYNVCSGTGVGTHALAREIIAATGSTATLTEQPVLRRDHDIPILVGSAEKLSRATGWRPRITRSDIIAEFLALAGQQ